MARDAERRGGGGARRRFCEAASGGASLGKHVHALPALVSSAVCTGR
jgi:hypothetical protein